MLSKEIIKIKIIKTENDDNTRGISEDQLDSRGVHFPSFSPPLPIARHGSTFPTFACLAFNW
jgi:hypothetical protein